MPELTKTFSGKDKDSSKMDSCFYTRSHCEDKRMGKLAASFRE
eukprot:CAMPEP_0185746936 /NCGR_PEP_ID=MMETSP1174-20130828/5605_1 /TAXON_ID=35687 /ORGANISM="Dictyocha speculum, Strain CCMP1381" /LENGTH=42 /DNA_ID= /DNA_START= /DNA_END= /DNA_ORIENTATION=